LAADFTSNYLRAAAAGACLYFIFYVPYFFIAPDRRYPTVQQGTYGRSSSFLLLLLL
jgi:hypothetical protein